MVQLTPKFTKKFRRRFRMPYPEFLVFLQRVSAADDFARWTRADAVGCQASPIGLLLLGTLRYLGRGLTFDDLEEYTSISEETHRQFLHVFITYGRDTLYPMYVQHPTTAEEYALHQKEFTIGGLNGAAYSFDGTNVIMWRCDHNLRQAHIGFKNSHPARTYNATVNHRGKFLHSTTGHPSRWNDKSLAYHDEFVKAIKEGRLLQDVTFELLEWSGTPGRSTINKQSYRGAWGITDNGFHRWSSTQAPAKIHFLETERRFSEWIESFRKDIECAFGILKGRFRVLKTGIRLQGTEAADKVWLTCLALHNMLLEIDGHTEEWQGELGQNDVAGMRGVGVPFALQRLSDSEAANFGSREHERSVDSRVTPLVQDDEDEEMEEFLVTRVDETGAIFVNSLSYSDFRRRLVVHFDILHRQRKIKWPKRR